MALAVVTRFLDVEEAQLARALLVSSGIRAYIVDERMASLSWHRLLRHLMTGPSLNRLLPAQTS